MEVADLGHGHLAGDPMRIQTGPPQHFVDDHVAETGDRVLVEKDGLQRRTPAVERVDEVDPTDCQRVRTEPIEVGIEHDASEPAWIVETEPATAAERECPPVPLRMILPTAIGELADRAHVVEQHAARHSEVDPNRRSIRHEHELLAAPIEARDRCTDDHRIDALGDDERVGALDARDLLTDEDEHSSAGQLDLEDFGHGTQSGKPVRAIPAREAAHS